MRRMKALAFLAFLGLLPMVAHAGGWACWAVASQRYGVPVNLLYSIAKVESSSNAHALHTNGNGTYDIGLMQINSTWLPKLSKYGITREKLLTDACLNLQVGAWILADSIKAHGLNWRGVGAYNAHADRLRAIYALRVAHELRSVEKHGYAATGGSR